MSSISTISYDLAAYNISKKCKYEEDSNKNEGRLGVWRFSRTFYYVSSTETKIKKLWYDFLVFIKLVIDHTDKRFAEINEISTKSHFTFNEKYYSKVTNKKSELESEIEKFKNDNKKLNDQISKLEIQIDTLNKFIREQDTIINNQNHDAIQSKNFFVKLKEETEAKINNLQTKLTQLQEQLALKDDN